jgi:hypothetical protein
VNAARNPLQAGRVARNRNWRVVSTVELDSPADRVWNMVGGFFTIHLWHPAITKTEIGSDQTSIPELRRIMTFPGQPKATEQLVLMDNENLYYRYKWHAGPWGEQVQKYHSELRVIETVIGKQCLVKWSSTFFYHEDALTQFYQDGFEVLKKKFGTPSGGKKK